MHVKADKNRSAEEHRIGVGIALGLSCFVAVTKELCWALFGHLAEEH